MSTSREFSANDGLLSEFVAEARDHLDSIEPDLLAMETPDGAVTPVIINRIFRAIHSIKGSAGFLGILPVTKLGHAMESVLMQMREGTVISTPERVDALLSAVDKLRLMIHDIKACEQVDFEDNLVKLGAIVSGPGPAPTSKVIPLRSEPVVQTKEDLSVGKGPADLVRLEVEAPNGLSSVVFMVEPGALSSIVHHFSLYAAWVHVQEDIRSTGRSTADFAAVVGTIGQALATDLEEFDCCTSVESSDEPSIKHLLMATRVDQLDIIGKILNIPIQRLVKISPEAREVVSGRLITKYQPHILPEPPLERASTAWADDREDVPAAGLDVSCPAPSAAGVPDEKAVPTSKTGIHETVRVTVNLIDRMMNLAGELVLGRNQLHRLLEESTDKVKGLAGVLQTINLVTSDLQEQIMNLRMQPVGNVFNKFPRVVRDLSRQLRKEVELVIEGGEVELDKSILEALSDPLTHLIRNAVDHAIEPPDERITAGKPRSGLIVLKAFHEAGQVNITLSDDGQGIDPKLVAVKAVQTKLVEPAASARMSDHEKMDLIFLPGFSMAGRVTDLSGRGVGLDIVRTNIHNVGGRLELESQVGQGTNFRLRLPLTLAIIPSLMVKAGGQTFALPQMDVQELISIQAVERSHGIEKVGEADILRLRGRLLP